MSNLNVRKPKIALIVDSDRWAFANIARQLQKNLQAHYEFKIIPSCHAGHMGRIALLAQDCDLVHVFWRMNIRELTAEGCTHYAAGLDFSYQEFFSNYIRDLNISTCVYDHLFLEAEQREELKACLGMARNYYVSSAKLAAVYQHLDGVKPPAAVLPDGVDTDVFKPRPDDDRTRPGPVVVGWAGNSQWHVGDLKGLHTIIKPAVAELRREGYPFTLRLADRAERFIPQYEMPDYYAAIDLYVCASRCEGTPNPVLEAMACGRPVISTDVGIVPEVFGPRQRAFIMRERSVAELKKLLLQFYRRPGLFGELAAENLSSIRPWDWQRKAADFKKYFDACLCPANCAG